MGFGASEGPCSRASGVSGVPGVVCTSSVCASGGGRQGCRRSRAETAAGTSRGRSGHVGVRISVFFILPGRGDINLSNLTRTRRNE